MPLFSAMAIALCFVHTLFGAWFLVAANEIRSWGRLITEFGEMYTGNFCCPLCYHGH